MAQSPNKDLQWQHPKDVLKLHKLKLRKKALQERINGPFGQKCETNRNTDKSAAFEYVLNGKKRKNPFAKDLGDVKRIKKDEELDVSADQTLFKLLNHSDSIPPANTSFTSFNGVLSKITEVETAEHENVDIVQAAGKSWCPIDWSLKKRMRLISLKPFPWNKKLKISEEASGITSFTRCLDIENSESTLDISPNSKFHQCCLYWQHPFLPWLTLFPRNASKSGSSEVNMSSHSSIKKSLYQSWTDSFKSLFQLIRTRQCPYFYMCANSFTVLFRAAGLLSYTDIHAIVTPTTRGFRHKLRQEEIEFTMPLKKKRTSDQGYETLDSECGYAEENSETDCKDKENNFDEEDAPDEEWLKTLGINSEDIKQINYTQARIEHKAECDVDNSAQSLVLIEGVEVNAFYNFLINSKSIIPPTGPLAGIPPTLLAPVSFHGATLSSLRIQENKIHFEGTEYNTLDLIGPILPTTMHNILNINARDHNLSIVLSDLESTTSFSKVKRRNQRQSDIERQGTTVFSKENLSDCGLNSKILKCFCSADPEIVCNIENVKYCGDTYTYTWS